MILERTSTFTAFTLPDGRRGGLCTEDKPKCVMGHDLKTNVEVTGDTIVHCAYRDPRPGVQQCNARLFVALFHHGGSAVIRDEGTRLWLVVEATADQVRHLSRVPLTVWEKLIYLQVTLPGVELDILQKTQRQRLR